MTLPSVPNSQQGRTAHRSIDMLLKKVEFFYAGELSVWIALSAEEHKTYATRVDDGVEGFVFPAITAA